MFKTFLLALIMISCFAAQAKASTPTKAPVKSTEEIDFVDKKDQKLLDLGKVDEFQGMLIRSSEKNPDLQSVDLYVFKKVTAMKMDQKLCQKMLAQIFGPLDKITLKVHNINIYQAHTGSTCEAQMDDPQHSSQTPERRVILGFINLQAYGLAFHLSHKSDAAIQENTRLFWDSLR